MSEPLFDVRTVGWLARDLPQLVAEAVPLGQALAVAASLGDRVVPSRDAGRPGAVRDILVRRAK